MTVYRPLDCKINRIKRYDIACITSIVGFLIAGEVPDQATLSGGGVILVGLLIFHFGDKLYRAFYSAKTEAFIFQ